MRRIEFGATFKKDYKRCFKRGLDMKIFEDVIERLQSDQTLPAKNRPHMLVGEWKGFCECHLAPDWLLIYDLSNLAVVALHRMGTHSDLFE